jgi:hypothetical protein
VAAVFTNLPPVLKNFHHPESLPQHTIGTTGFLRSFSCQSQSLPHSVCAALKRLQKLGFLDCSMTNDSFFIQTLTSASKQVRESCQRNENQNVRPQLNDALRHISNPRPITLIPITKMSREITLVWLGGVRRHKAARLVR